MHATKNEDVYLRKLADMLPDELTHHIGSYLHDARQPLANFQGLKSDADGFKRAEKLAQIRDVSADKCAAAIETTRFMVLNQGPLTYIVDFGRQANMPDDSGAHPLEPPIAGVFNRAPTPDHKMVQHSVLFPIGFTDKSSLDLETGTTFVFKDMAALPPIDENMTPNFPSRKLRWVFMGSRLDDPKGLMAVSRDYDFNDERLGKRGIHIHITDPIDPSELLFVPRTNRIPQIDHEQSPQYSTRVKYVQESIRGLSRGLSRILAGNNPSGTERELIFDNMGILAEISRGNTERLDVRKSGVTW